MKTKLTLLGVLLVALVINTFRPADAQMPSTRQRMSVNTGAADDGTQRVVLATDSGLAANQSVNLAQVAGATTATGSGTAATSLRVELPTNGTGVVGLNAGANLIGKIVPFPGTLKSGVTAAMTGTTSTAVIAAQASNYIYVTSCTFSNNHATVATVINLQDGSGGTTLWTVTSKPVSDAPNNVTWPDGPLKVPTLGNGLFAVNVTTGSNTFVSCAGYYSTVSY